MNKNIIILGGFLDGKRTNSTREKECPLFDSLWNVGTYKYIVPSKSFCSDYCAEGHQIPKMNEPYWFECKLETMPNIVFFMGNNRSCSIMTKNGKDDQTNQACINQVASSLAGLQQYSPTLIYLTHGFNYNLSGKEAKILKKMKDRLLERYNTRNIVVGMVVWNYGSRNGYLQQWQTMDNNGQYSLPMELGVQSRIRNIPNEFSRYVVCCKPKTFLFSTYGIASSTTWAVGNILAYVNREIEKKPCRLDIWQLVLDIALVHIFVASLGKWSR